MSPAFMGTDPEDFKFAVVGQKYPISSTGFREILSSRIPEYRQGVAFCSALHDGLTLYLYCNHALSKLLVVVEN